MTLPDPRLLAQRRVVVVDDDVHQASALAALLRLEGVVATSEHVAETALARMMIEPPDAIVLNVKMPGLSGTELLAALRVRHPHLPVLLMTGYEAHDPRLATALATRGVSYVGKPVELSRLCELLALHLGDRGLPEA
jgi:DNA-binding NtrC family response regulator